MLQENSNLQTDEGQPENCGFPQLCNADLVTDPVAEMAEHICRELFSYQNKWGCGFQSDIALTDEEIEEANRIHSAALIAEVQALTTGRSGR